MFAANILSDLWMRNVLIEVMLKAMSSFLNGLCSHVIESTHRWLYDANNTNALKRHRALVHPDLPQIPNNEKVTVSVLAKFLKHLFVLLHLLKLNYSKLHP